MAGAQDGPLASCPYVPDASFRATGRSDNVAVRVERRIRDPIARPNGGNDAVGVHANYFPGTSFGGEDETGVGADGQGLRLKIRTRRYDVKPFAIQRIPDLDGAALSQDSQLPVRAVLKLGRAAFR